MPTPPRRVTARGPRYRRPGPYAEAVKPEHTADAYRWLCPTCPCETNLRGLLREECSHCGHQHFPDVRPKEAS